MWPEQGSYSMAQILFPRLSEAGKEGSHARATGTSEVTSSDPFRQNIGHSQHWVALGSTGVHRPTGTWVSTARGRVQGRELAEEGTQRYVWMLLPDSVAGVVPRVSEG